MKNFCAKILVFLMLFTLIPVNLVQISAADIIYGDTNGDSKVDTADYATLRRYLLNKTVTLAGNFNTVADLNQDGKIDTADYTVLRKYLLEIITTLPYVTSTITPTPTPTVTSIFKNHDIELGTADWWHKNDSCTLTADSTQKHSGNYSMKVTERTKTWQGPAQYTIYTMVDGTYDLSAWVLLDNAETDNMMVTLKKTDSDGSTYTPIATAAVNNSSWVELKGTFTVTDINKLIDMMIYFEGPAADVNFYLDDVVVTPHVGPIVTSTPAPTNTSTPTPTPTVTSIFKNHDIELGTADWWHKNDSCTLTADSTQKHSGNYSMKVTERTKTWQGPAQYTIYTMVDGTYDLSAWVLLDNAETDNMMITLKKTDSDGSTYTPIATAAVNNSSWVELKGTFTVTDINKLIDMMIYFEGPAADVNFYLDDVVVTPHVGPIATSTPTSTPTLEPILDNSGL